MKTADQKFESLWYFLEPKVRQLFYEIFKEGFICATEAEEATDEKEDTE